MHPTMKTTRRAIAGLAVLAGLLGGSAIAQPTAQPPTLPPPADVKMDKTTGALIVPLSGAVRFNPGPKLIADIFVRNEDVLQVRPDPRDPKILILTGKVAGATQIKITFEDKSKADYDVIVQPDYDLLRSVIKRTVPTASVDVVPGVGNVIILSGYVVKPEDSDFIQRIASSAVGGVVSNVINALQIGGAQHVLIDVTVAQVDRTEIRERGFSFGVTGTSVGFSSILSGLAITNVATNLFGGAAAAVGAPITPGATANLVTGIVPAGTLGALRALRTEGLAKFLSEPKVITQTGRPALLRAGGQQAILGPSSGINGPGVILEQVGTQLEVLPIVFGNGKIYLEVTPQFRSVNNGRGVSTAFGFTPGFNESSVRSSVLMESGQTYAIGGLLETTTQNSAEKVPYLGELPYIGMLFSNVRSEERESELLILVTPRLVDALDCNQVPKRLPGKETRNVDDYELFIEGILEAPRGQRKVWNGRCYVPAYKCSETVGQYPCIGNLCPGGGCQKGTCPATGGVIGLPVALAPASPNTLPAIATPTESSPVQPAGIVLPIPEPAPSPAPMMP